MNVMSLGPRVQLMTEKSNDVMSLGPRVQLMTEKSNVQYVCLQRGHRHTAVGQEKGVSNTPHYKCHITQLDTVVYLSNSSTNNYIL